MDYHVRCCNMKILEKIKVFQIVRRTNYIWEKKIVCVCVDEGCYIQISNIEFYIIITTKKKRKNKLIGSNFGSITEINVFKEGCLKKSYTNPRFHAKKTLNIYFLICAIPHRNVPTVVASSSCLGSNY